MCYLERFLSTFEKSVIPQKVFFKCQGSWFKQENRRNFNNYLSENGWYGRNDTRVLPIFDNKMFDDWEIKMLVIIGFQDIAKVMVDELGELSLRSTEEEKKKPQGVQKLNRKQGSLFISVSFDIFNKISKTIIAKEA